MRYLVSMAGHRGFYFLNLNYCTAHDDWEATGYRNLSCPLKLSSCYRFSGGCVEYNVRNLLCSLNLGAVLHFSYTYWIWLPVTTFCTLPNI